MNQPNSGRDSKSGLGTSSPGGTQDNSRNLNDLSWNDLLFTPMKDLAPLMRDAQSPSVTTGVSNQANRSGSFHKSSSKAGKDKKPKSRTKTPLDEPIFKEMSKRIGLDQENGFAAKNIEGKRIDLQDKVFQPGPFSFFIGVILPIALMGVESTTHLLARELFDPFPTFQHILLFSLIPASNFLTWLAVRLNITSLYAVTSLASGMALGVGVLYSLMLLPVAPLFIFYIIFFGFGLIYLSPLLALPTTILCGKTLCHLAARERTFFDAHQMKHLGHLIILVMVIAVELPSTMTRMHLSMATHESSRKEGLDWLRAWGNKEVLLRACYERSGRATDILGSLYEHQDPVSVDNARKVYYAVTGVPFNSVPIPNSFRSTIQHAGLVDDPARLNEGATDEFDLDPDIAGEMVAGVARGLAAKESIISGKLDGQAALASLDWTFSFDNVSTVPREARAKILLPPGAVVTRATLWLNSLEKETKIMGKSLARATYVESVRNHKMDPLLVSMDGKDTVLVQCYPVMKGVTTKIRLHIVSPMELSDSGKQATLTLPTFAERNFAFSAQHKLALSAKTNLAMIVDGKPIKDRTQTYAGDLENSYLGRFEALVRVDRDASRNQVWSPNNFAGASKLITRETVSQEHVSKPTSLTIVVDQSITMQPYMEQVIEGLKQLPRDLPLALKTVLDDDRELCRGVTSSSLTFLDSLHKLQSNKCAGGQDSRRAVALSMDLLGQRNGDVTNNCALLWIHAAQPEGSFDPGRPADLTATKLMSERAPFPLYDLQVASGPNSFLKDAQESGHIIRVPRTGALSTDMAHFFKSFSADEPASAGNVLATTPGDMRGLYKASDELAQLQAYRDVLRVLYAGDQSTAVALSQQYHLVTPVSSAVVTDDVPMPKVQDLRKNSFISRGTGKMLRELAPVALNPLTLLTGCSQTSNEYEAKKASLDYKDRERSDAPMLDMLSSRSQTVPASDPTPNGLRETAGSDPPSSMAGAPGSPPMFDERARKAEGKEQLPQRQAANEESNAKNRSFGATIQGQAGADKADSAGGSVGGKLLSSPFNKQTETMSFVGKQAAMSEQPTFSGKSSGSSDGGALQQMLHPTPEPDEIAMVLIAILAFFAAIFFNRRKPGTAKTH